MLALALGAESLLVNQGLKRLFRRPRPTVEGDPRYPVRRPPTSSFPSGHASAAAFTAVAAHGVGRPAHRRRCGGRSPPPWPSSRAYVRIHHASDVVAGMAAGAVLGLGARRDPAALRESSLRRESLTIAMTRRFGLTFDYRCPFARIAHEHVVDGPAGRRRLGRHVPAVLAGPGPRRRGRAAGLGAPRDGHRPARPAGVVAVRDTQPDHFLDAHHALFEHRHAAAGQLGPRRPRRRARRRPASTSTPCWPRSTAAGRWRRSRRSTRRTSSRHTVWGVPTFIVGDRAVFVRLMDLPDGDGDARHAHDRARARPDRVADPQRVQAHVDPALTTVDGRRGRPATAPSCEDRRVADAASMTGG